MSHAIIRGKSGRRHEVDFEDCALRVEIHASDETVEIFVEADINELPEERRRFALINIPRHLFSQATAEAPNEKTSSFDSEPGPDRSALSVLFREDSAMTPIRHRSE